MTDSGSLDWDKVSYVRSSEYRQDVLKRLVENPQTPSGIRDATGIKISHVSRALNELEEKGLAELLVSEDRKKGRFYGATDEGERVWEYLAEN